MAIDLNSCVVSWLAVALVVFMSLCTNEDGYPLETNTDDKCFFSSAIAEGFIMKCLA